MPHKIASEHLEIALRYVVEVARFGHLVSDEELDAYMNDNPLRERRAGPGFASTARLFAALAASFASSEMFAATPAPSVTDRLIDLRWVTWNRQGLVPTRLGRAVLASLDAADAPSGADVVEMVLDTTDPVAWPRLLGKVADLSDAFIVDPYFGIDELLEVVPNTRVSRILVGSQLSEGRLATLKVGAATLQLDRTVEIRVADELHDRYVIGPDRVLQLGTSFNGVGKKPTVLAELRDVAGAVREQWESAWKDARELCRIDYIDPWGTDHDPEEDAEADPEVDADTGDSG